MRFDYSEEQWAKILASMHDLPTAKACYKSDIWRLINARCTKNPRLAGWQEQVRVALMQFDYQQTCRSELLGIATRYLDLAQAARPRAARVKRWKKVAHLAAQLREAILKMDDPRDKDILGRIEWKTYGSRTLSDFAAAAAAAIDLFDERSEHEHARLSLYRELLDLWSNLGGFLRYKQRDAEPRGPLISFMQATLGPILKKRKVSPQTIRVRIDCARRAADRDDGLEESIAHSETLMRLDTALRNKLCLEIRSIRAWYKPLKWQVNRIWLIERLEIEDLLTQFVEGLTRDDLLRFFDILDDGLRPRIDVAMARALKPPKFEGQFEHTWCATTGDLGQNRLTFVTLKA
jgi:hypothetical protein